MKVTITKANYTKMVNHAIKELPNEACGLIGGTVAEDGSKDVQEVYLLDNLDESNEHFSLDPRQQLEAVKDMRAKGLSALGNWHSHPETPARPSEEDKRLAYDSKASYMILSLADEDAPVLRSFRISGGESSSEELEIVEATR